MIKKIFPVIAIVAGAIVFGLLLSLFKVPVGQAGALSAAFVLILLPIFLKRPEFALVLIGFCLPFERVPTLELGGATVKINHLLIVLAFISYLIYLFSQKNHKIKSDPTRFFLILFLITLTFSLPLSGDFSRGVQVFAFMILMAVLYLITTFILQKKEALVLVIKGVVWGAVISALAGLYQFIGDAAGLSSRFTFLKEGYDKSTFGFARVQAFSQEPLYFSNYIFIPLFILIILLIRGQMKPVFKKSWAIALVCALLLNFILAISRGAYLAAAVAIVILAVAQAKHIFKARIILPIAIGLFVVIGGSYLALLKSEPRALDEFISHIKIEDRDVGESVVMRLNASKEAQELFLDRPLFGVGLGNFGPAVKGYPSEEPVEGWPIVNNEYLELLAENGVFGLAAFLIFLAVVYTRAIVAYLRAQDQEMKAFVLALMFALFAILAQYLTFSTLYIIHVWFVIGLLAASSNMILNQNEK